jgi:pimeloyl-ACP methyl ester carboxylesterase
MTPLFIALLIALAACTLHAAEPNSPPAKSGVAGLWLGVMQVGPVHLRMAFDISATKDGAITGKLLSLDQNRAEVPCESFSYDANKLTIEMPAISARYTGELSADAQSIAGEFIQLDNPVALNLKRIDKLPTLNRPQHPKKPYPYREEEVSFTNEAASIELAGTLTIPNGDGPFPAVVLVTGSGPQDRDQTLFEHKPFLVIADYLTRRGMAVLRFDDRGFGKSGGAFAGSTTNDFASDAHAAMAYLLTRKEIDAERVGIIGHSEGAIAAQIVASDHPDDVAFVVFLAGFGVSGEQLALAQSTDVVRSAGGSEQDIKLSTDLMRELIPIAKESGTTGEIHKKLVAAAAEFIAKLEDQKVRAALAGSEEAVASRLVDPWVRFFLNYDTAKTLGRVKCPVLALAGSRDIQVRSRENLRAMEDALRAGGNRQVTTVELQNLNHLFQTCTTGDVSEYGSIEETFSPEALSAMSKWIRAQLDPRPSSP